VYAEWGTIMGRGMELRIFLIELYVCVWGETIENKFEEERRCLIAIGSIILRAQLRRSALYQLMKSHITIDLLYSTSLSMYLTLNK